MSMSKPIFRLLTAGLLGAATALLISCGGSSAGLIPVGNAGPLQSDFEAVAQAAQNGDGDCSGAKAQILKTEQDFNALPATVDNGLRNTLRQGISNLRSRALVLCSQPLAQTATDTTPKTTTTNTDTTPTTPTTPTQTAPTQTTPPTSSPAPSSPGGGTQAPGETPPETGGAPGGGAGAGENEAGGGEANGGGSPGGAAGGGVGAGAQETGR